METRQEQKLIRQRDEARAETVEAREAYGLMCESVATLRGLVEKAFVAGAVWSIKGLPISARTVEAAAKAEFERWLEQMVG